jgi:hypothetical protein
MNRKTTMVSVIMGILVLALPVGAQEKADDTAELAKKLANPIASLISVPIQGNLDFGIGPADAKKLTVNIQPVIPFSLNSNWNLITRTIFPVIYAEAPAVGLDTTSVAQGVGRRVDRRRRSGSPVPQRDRENPRFRQVGGRSNRGYPETAERLYLRNARQSYLVLCRFREQ